VIVRDYSRFIPGEEIEQAQPWSFNAIDTAAQLLAAKARERRVQQAQQFSEQVRQDGFEQGFQAGLAEGRHQAEAEMQARMQAFMDDQGQQLAQRLQQLFEAAQGQVQSLQQTLAQGVLDVASDIARQVIRRELSLDTQAVLPVVLEALEVLGADHKAAVVRLNPQDLEALGTQIESDFANLALTLRGDPTLEAGGCVVESAGTVVDASLPKRWQRVVATLGQAKTWESDRDRG
jgi:flagellar assembly protein FliH